MRITDRDQVAELVLGDIQGSVGIRGLHDFFTAAEVLGLSATVHSGTELGVELDERRLVQYDLTPERHRRLDEEWQGIRSTYAIPPAGQDLLVRHF